MLEVNISFDSIDNFHFTGFTYVYKGSIVAFLWIRVKTEVFDHTNALSHRFFNETAKNQPSFSELLEQQPSLPIVSHTMILTSIIHPIPAKTAAIKSFP
jgi:hypothetical protein